MHKTKLRLLHRSHATLAVLKIFSLGNLSKFSLKIGLYRRVYIIITRATNRRLKELE